MVFRYFVTALGMQLTTRMRGLPLLLSGVMAAACGSAESPKEDIAPPALAGTYYSPSSEHVRWVQFDGDRFTSISGVDASVHSGTYRRDADGWLTLDDGTTQTQFRVDIQQSEASTALVAQSLTSGDSQIVSGTSNLGSRATQFSLTDGQSSVTDGAPSRIVVADARLATYYAICLLAIGQVMTGVPGAKLPDTIPDPPTQVASGSRCAAGGKK